ncbi:MAG: hypothetical protein DBY36_06185 [Clostridiales bacterium]|nr:MAG: hypothetical protein DBY36_06185 [Clostridiales bacterium]
MRRFIGLCLSLAMVLTLFVACGTEKQPQTSDNTSVASTSDVPKTDATTETTVTTPTAEKIDLEGYKFVFYHDVDISRYMPQPNLNALHDEWLAEMREIEEKYNFTYNEQQGSSNYETYYTATMGGISLGDFCMTTQTHYIPGGITNVFEPLDSEKMLAAGFNPYDETKWNQEYSSLTNIGGHYWGVLPVSKYITMPLGFMVIFNKDIVESLGYDLYEIVRNNEWTWDKYLEVAQKASIDNDGDGIYDRWGIASVPGQVEMYTNGGGILQNVDSKWTYVGNTPSVVESLQFIYDEYNLGYYNTALTKGSEKADLFVRGDAAMTWVAWYHLQPYGGDPFWQCEFDYGVIPSPMGPSADGYVNVVDGLDAFVMMTTNQNYEKSVICMNAYGEAFNSPNWTERYEDGRLRDEESMEMITEYIAPNMVVNVNRIQPDVRSVITDEIVVPVRQGDLSISTALESQEQVIQKMLDDFFHQN